MKKVLVWAFIAMAAVLVTAWAAQANPFLVCDPQAGVTSYQLSGAAWAPASVPAQTDGSIRLDMAAVPAGTYTVNVKACASDPSWGEVCSVSAPFTFTRPSSPVPPLGLKLVQ